MTATKDELKESAKPYELGVLLTPLLTEEAALAWFDETFKKLLVQAGAEIIPLSVTTPKLFPLAYTIRKRIDNKNQVFREAYLASLQFVALPEQVLVIKDNLRKVSEIVRSLLIIVPPPEAAKLEEPSTPSSVASPLPEKELIDREIDGLLSTGVNAQ